MSEVELRPGEPEARMLGVGGEEVAAKAEAMARAGQSWREHALTVNEVAAMAQETLSELRAASLEHGDIDPTERSEAWRNFESITSEIYLRQGSFEDRETLIDLPLPSSLITNNETGEREYLRVMCAQVAEKEGLDFQEVLNITINDMFDHAEAAVLGPKKELAAKYTNWAELHEEAAGRIYDSDEDFDASELIRIEQTDIPEWEAQIVDRKKTKHYIRSMSLGELFRLSEGQARNCSQIIDQAINSEMVAWLQGYHSDEVTIFDIRQKAQAIYQKQIDIDQEELNGLTELVAPFQQPEEASNE